MKTVKNIAKNDLEIGIEGFDYLFPAGVAVACEDNIADFMAERCPLFEIERLSVGKEGENVPRVTTKPTKVFVKRVAENDMVINRQPKDDTVPADLMPNGTDSDGIVWDSKLEKDTP